MTTIAIIGTAGRDEAKHHLQTLDLYMRCFKCIETHVLAGALAYDPKSNLKLVSGGAAWIDHIAVSLNKRHNMPLTLHLPAPWDFVTGQYMDTRDGCTANYYHRQFSQQIGQDSLKSLNSALQRESVSHTISTDFKARNALVAKSEIIYALTWGEGDIPTPGGTRHTWDLAKGVKRHWSLNRFVR